MTTDEAIAFVKKNGVVLLSGKGPVPRLTEAIVKETIKGSWWAHPKSHQIFTVLQAVTDSDDILVCRLVEGKVTLVHRRLWPVLIRLATRFPKDRLAQVRQEHTVTGQHVRRDIPFPKWVSRDLHRKAKAIKEEKALLALRPWIATPNKALQRTPRTARRRRASARSAAIK